VTEKTERKIRVNLSEWSWGEWDDMLRNGIKVDIDVDPKYHRFSIEFNMQDGLEEIIKTIATQVLEVFFNNNLMPLALSENGIVIEDESMSESLVIPWAEVHSKISLKKLQAVIAKEFENFIDEEDEEDEDDSR
jgi:hypothetical protein